MIMTQTERKPAFKSVQSTSKDMIIKNIIHDYSNIDTNEMTYKILSELRKEKRIQNLDLLEDYEE